MKRLRRASYVAAACLVVSVLATAQDQEKRIQRSELPPAVEKTVVAQSQGAAIRGFSREKENGKTFYEAELTENGHTKDVLIDENGAVVEIEQQVAINSLSQSVRNALQSKAGNGKIVKVESLTKHAKLVAYEAQVRTNGKLSEIQVGRQGEPLAHEE